MSRIEEIEGRLSAAIELTGEPVSRISVDPSDLRFLLDFAKAAREALKAFLSADTPEGVNLAYDMSREALALLEGGTQ